jgi:hypothetical protein
MFSFYFWVRFYLSIVLTLVIMATAISKPSPWPQMGTLSRTIRARIRHQHQHHVSRILNRARLRTNRLRPSHVPAEPGLDTREAAFVSHSREDATVGGR